MVLFISGASVRASKSLHRHIIAFEYDSILYKEVLVPLLPQAEEVQSVKVTRSSPKKKRPWRMQMSQRRRLLPSELVSLHYLSSNF